MRPIPAQSRESVLRLERSVKGIECPINAIQRKISRRLELPDSLFRLVEVARQLGVLSPQPR